MVNSKTQQLNQTQFSDQKALSLELYKNMKRIRLFEEKIDWLFAKGRLGGTTHLSIGQEAVAVGIITHLKRNDCVTSSHRGHGHLIAKGGEMHKMFSELMGKVGGYCQGKGGTQHMCAKEIGFYGTNGITGGCIPIATGIALSAKLQKTDQIAVSFFGDGAANQGTFHESLNMASIWSLPIIYVCENNLYGMSTHMKDVTSNEDFAQRVKAYSMESRVINGMDIREVYETAKEVVDYVRTKKKPFFIEAKTYRFCGHSKSDPRKYRSKEEEQVWRQQDCIEIFRNHLARNLEDKDSLKNIDEEIQREVETALQLSEQAQDVPEELAMKGVYKDV